MDPGRKIVSTTYPETVAGHQFDRLTERCVNPKYDQAAYPGGVCGVHRNDVHTATLEDVSAVYPRVHFCCSGLLNAREYNEIRDDVQLRAEIARRAYDAVSWAVKGE